MITVGITGGIGSGKTTICKVWEDLGAYILSADDLAKNIMTENREIKEQITERFGGRSYRKDGSLNREYLAEEAFGKNRVNELNAIVHPHIPSECRDIMGRERSRGRKVFVYEAALLLQNQRPCYFDYIVLVLTDREKRIERVMRRDRSESVQVIERISKQEDFKKLVHLADFVIYNNGSLGELRRSAEQVYGEFFIRSSNQE